MALTTERDKAICARYSARGPDGKVGCNECPLGCKVFDMPPLSCKAIMHYDRHRQEWVYDDEQEVSTEE